MLGLGQRECIQGEGLYMCAQTHTHHTYYKHTSTHPPHTHKCAHSTHTCMDIPQTHPNIPSTYTDTQIHTPHTQKHTPYIHRYKNTYRVSYTYPTHTDTCTLHTPHTCTDTAQAHAHHTHCTNLCKSQCVQSCKCSDRIPQTWSVSRNQDNPLIVFCL